MKKNAILLVYGSGGHKAQMQRLLMLLTKEFENDILFVSCSEDNNQLENVGRNYCIQPLRDKHSNLKTLFKFPQILVSCFLSFISIQRTYNTVSVITTGPGIGIFFSIIFKMFDAKIIFIETWSRFDTKSLTGTVMYKIADKFYIQNMSLLKFYPNAIFSGML